VNTLALRVQLSGELSVSDLLTQVREATLGAYAHQATPFEQVVEALHPARSLSHSPVFQVMFILQNAPQGELRMPGLRLSPQDQSGEVAQFDLTLSLQEVGDEIVGVMNYASDLFEEGTIQRWVGYLGRIYEQLARDAQQALQGISVLDESECEQLLREFNATEMSYPQETLIHELFEAQVRRTPEAVAIEHAGELIRYGELNRKADALAQWLGRAGVQVGDRVGICLERSIQMVAGILGVLKAGGTYVPIDPEYPRARIEYIVADAAVVGVLSDRAVSERVGVSGESGGRWWLLDELSDLDQLHEPDELDQLDELDGLE
jgi:non-ribosomal peptide synthetase component F